MNVNESKIRNGTQKQQQQKDFTWIITTWKNLGSNVAISTFSRQFVTILRFGELVANSYEFIWSHSYVFGQSAYTHWGLDFGVELHAYFFS